MKKKFRAEEFELAAQDFAERLEELQQEAQTLLDPECYSCPVSRGAAMASLKTGLAALQYYFKQASKIS